MENSPTGNGAESTASLPTQPTEPVQQQQPAEQNQETISREESQGKVSDDTANQNQNPQGDGQQTQTQTGGDNQTDDGLAKFAASQGFDLTNATDDVKRALKIAHDNQKAFRTKEEGKKITDTTEKLGDGSIEAEVAQLKYERTTDKFFSDGRDRALESTMVEILNEKAEQYGKDYAFNLSRDLDSLYGMAQLKRGASTGNVDVEAIRREERESIRRQSTASADNAHATQQGQSGEQKIDRNWLETQYDPSNVEHQKLVDQAVQNGDL